MLPLYTPHAYREISNKLWSVVCGISAKDNVHLLLVLVLIFVRRGQFNKKKLVSQGVSMLMRVATV